MTINATLNFQPVHPSLSLDTLFLTIGKKAYSVIEYEEHIVFRDLDRAVDIGYIKPCIMTDAIDVYTCDLFGDIAEFTKLVDPKIVCR